jgi:hypothetical protein
MANLIAGTKPRDGVQYDIWEGRYYGGDTYFHFKTNIPLDYTMCMIEAVGYSYGANQAIRAAWCFYTYAPANNVIQVGIQNYYGGLSADRVYLSSDGYAVVVANCASYFSGWTLNAYTQNPTGYNYNVQITAVAQLSSNANYY